MSKRYVRRGDDSIPRIYPGTLAGLREAMSDAKALGGEHSLWVHDPPQETRLFRVIKNGRVAWAPKPTESDKGS